MKKYISVSKKVMEKRADNIDRCFGEVNNIICDLAGIASLIDLKEEEVEALENVLEILINKLDKIDEILEDENNEFYEMINYDCEV